ncbi:E3 ubiquitin-protein ligase TRIM21-like [Aulostomus maculatus]
MSAASRPPSEDQFLCSICLDVFTEPVSTPCGHNFCKNCITTHWNSRDSPTCPLCKKSFSSKPELQVNTLFSEAVAHLRQRSQQEACSGSSQQQVAEPGEVQCDVCTGTKVKALKSCLVCLVSYCENHLEHHLTVPVLRKHQLISPVENLEGRLCMKHKKPLEFFCKTHQMCVCLHCIYSDHKTHDVVPLEEEYEGKVVELRKTEAEIQQMILKRRLKVQEIQHSVDLSEEDASRKIEEVIQIFTALKESVERSLNELLEAMEEKRRTAKNQAEDLIQELQQKISELMERSSEVEQLSRSEDHLHLLQSFPSLKTTPADKGWTDKGWTDVSVAPPSYDVMVIKAVTQLEEKLGQDLKRLFDAELKRVQQYEEDVTLDPDTAHPELFLSDDGKQVNHVDEEKNVPDHPKRFSTSVAVLGKQSFSSGRFYFEVQVKGKTKWNLGVTRESSKRKGGITLTPQEGHWALMLRNDGYKAADDTLVSLSLKSVPQKVGVFVDYDEGAVSFYDVDTAALIYSFTGCNFTEKLHPYFCPCLNDGGKNSTPLIICPVNQTA